MAEEQKGNDANAEKWQLYYWKLRNRGNWIRYLFEEAQVDYVDHSTINTDIKPYFTLFSDGNKNPLNDTQPAFAPPAIQKGNLFLSQSEVIVNYLASELNLAPKDPFQRIASSQILANCNDILREIYALRARVWTDKQKINQFFADDGRFEKRLNVIEKPLIGNDDKDATKIFYFENRCTYIDLIVFNLMDGVQELTG
eukprot:303254_1